MTTTDALDGDGLSVPGPLTLLMAPLDAPKDPSRDSAIGSIRPFALRVSVPALTADVPDHRFDPVLQVAVNPDGSPLGPRLAKDWTTYASTHTDGDGGDNETWGWEEQSS